MAKRTGRVCWRCARKASRRRRPSRAPSWSHGLSVVGSCAGGRANGSGQASDIPREIGMGEGRKDNKWTGVESMTNAHNLHLHFCQLELCGGPGFRPPPNTLAIAQSTPVPSRFSRSRPSLTPHSSLCSKGSPHAQSLAHSILHAPCPSSTRPASRARLSSSRAHPEVSPSSLLLLTSERFSRSFER